MTFVTACTGDRKEFAWELKPSELQSADNQPGQQSVSTASFHWAASRTSAAFRDAEHDEC